MKSLETNTDEVRVFGIAMIASAFTAHEVDGKISSIELSRGHDFHAFYRLGKGNEDKVIHVQFYPGMSTKEYARVFARLMNYDKMMQIRRYEGVSKGNEHDAVIRPFPNFSNGIEIPDYNPSIIEQMVEENVSEIRRQR